MTAAQEKRIKLKKLLASEGCTPVPGIYDAVSARIVEKSGFEAVYLGNLKDIGLLGLPEVVMAAEPSNHVKNVADCIQIPLICDIRNRTDSHPDIAQIVREFEASGVSGIHLDDFEAEDDGVSRTLDSEEMCGLIRKACDARSDFNFQIFARTAMQKGRDPEELIKMSNLYLDAGADAVYIASSNAVTKEIRSKIRGPVVAANCGRSVREESDADLNISIYWPMLLYSALTAFREECDAFMQLKDYSKLNKSVLYDEGSVRFVKYKYNGRQAANMN